ncbi:hypothetical protein BXY85_3731 [Roseivirga pacifica]|uniref:SecDF P1 head subdomain domain-containing protein n=1 Tax=Roseivirga pacifica TaxID=1267423 RepID=A0A1I0QB10_9BACT|nr:hypothetical protein [Roseivirga pacifica]RKQ43112.1 hypothetical protein BXY85_3731 [Roseivirga pacifica]SEW23773.1 hypothetical protein SAMN05216290_2144 [Roseivirga pacifica]
MSLQAQTMDSTWVKGQKKLEDGYYKADKITFSNVLVTDYQDSSNFYFVDEKLEIPLNSLEDATITENNNGNTFILLKFKSGSHKRWEELTSNQVGKELVLIVNNQLVQASKINMTVFNGMSAINRNDLSQEQMQGLMKMIKERIK